MIFALQNRTKIEPWSCVGALEAPETLRERPQAPGPAAARARGLKDPHPVPTVLPSRGWWPEGEGDGQRREGIEVVRVPRHAGQRDRLAAGGVEEFLAGLGPVSRDMAEAELLVGLVLLDEVLLMGAMDLLVQVPQGALHLLEPPRLELVLTVEDMVVVIELLLDVLQPGCTPNSVRHERKGAAVNKGFMAKEGAGHRWAPPDAILVLYLNLFLHDSHLLVLKLLH